MKQTRIILYPNYIPSRVKEQNVSGAKQKEESVSGDSHPIRIPNAMPFEHHESFH